MHQELEQALQTSRLERLKTNPYLPARCELRLTDIKFSLDLPHLQLTISIANAIGFFVKGFIMSASFV